MRDEPWLAPGAREWLEARARPGWAAFEWGSGGSTLWLERLCASVTSVEHDEAWFWKVGARIGRSTRLHWHPPTDEEPGAYGSTWPGCFRDYVRAIDGAGPFDLVLVDGRARAACVRHALPETRGVLVLDNAERPWYREAVELLDGWGKRVDFRQGEWTTSAWTR